MHHPRVSLAITGLMAGFELPAEFRQAMSSLSLPFSSSSSSSIEHALREMMLMSPTTLEDFDEHHVESFSEKQSQNHTTPLFAETSACPRGQFSTPSTQLAMTQPDRTVCATESGTEVKPNKVFLPAHGSDTQSSSPVAGAASFVTSLRQQHAALAESRSLFATAQQSNIVEEKVTAVASEIPHVAEPDTKNSRPLPRNLFFLPPNKSTEASASDVMSVSTPTATPDGAAKNGCTKKKKGRRSSAPPNEGQSTGRWTEEEHQAFLRGLHTYGREWKKVASLIPTRSSAQVRSHAQKYFAKLHKGDDIWTVENNRNHGFVCDDGTNAGSTNHRAEGANQGGILVHDEALRPMISSSVQANVDRILANPERVESEVEDTLRRLRERYQQLQRRLERTSPSPGTGKRRNPYSISNDDQSSTATSLSASLQNEELIALSVLQGDLPRGDASSSANASELSTEENLEVDSHQSEYTDSRTKRAKLG